MEGISFLILKGNFIHSRMKHNTTNIQSASFQQWKLINSEVFLELSLSKHQFPIHQP